MLLPGARVIICGFIVFLLLPYYTTDFWVGPEGTSVFGLPECWGKNKFNSVVGVWVRVNA
jgi:hypothetical protein